LKTATSPYLGNGDTDRHETCNDDEHCSGRGNFTLISNDTVKAWHTEIQEIKWQLLLLAFTYDAK